MSQPRAVHPGLAAWRQLRDSGALEGALVTMVRADGGASKTLGTHLAVAADGRWFGSVTVGGCADGRAIEAARRVLASGDAERITLPLSEADAVALGLGCAGEVDLLVEHVVLGDASALALDDAAAGVEHGEPMLLLTAMDRPRGRLLVRADGSLRGTTRDERVDASARALADALFREKGSVTGLHEHDGVAWFVEQLAPVRTVMIVGATEIAAALCTLMRPLGWRAVLLDPRDDVLAQPRFADAAERVPSIPAEVVAQRMQGALAPAVVVVAHDYRVELPVLRAALAGDSPYVGMLGSRKRGATMRAMLAEEGVDASRIARLRSPIGLAIGAEGPVEIAVSILAELVATWRGVAPRP
jgi:xanthine dehydrogenase accessory factor